MPDTAISGDMPAQIALTMLKFDQEVLPRSMIWMPEAPGEPGVASFVVLPTRDVITADAMPAFLAALPKPVLLAPLASRGMVGLWRPTDDDPRGTTLLRHTIANNTASLASKAARYGLDTSSRIVLEAAGVKIVFSLSDLQEWARDYAVNVWWTLAPLDGSARASCRVVLMRADGSKSPGARGCSCGPGPST
jgi:hypothetical protein